MKFYSLDYDFDFGFSLSLQPNSIWEGINNFFFKKKIPLENILGLMGLILKGMVGCEYGYECCTQVVEVGGKCWHVHSIVR